MAVRPISAYLSPDECRRLAAWKRTYRPLLRFLSDAERRRLRFVRWLLDTGRLER